MSSQTWIPLDNTLQTIKNASVGAICFIVVNILSPIWVGAIILMMLWRVVMRLVFKTYYKDKYITMDPHDAVAAVESYANLTAINSFAFLRGKCDIKAIKHLTLSRFLNYQENGKMPYTKFKYKLSTMYGFYCWEDTSDSFSIDNHVRVCPGIGDIDQLCTEKEMFEAIQNIMDIPFSNSRPKWELLIIPRLAVNNSPGVYHALIFRVSHIYLDGVSLSHVLRKCFADWKPKLLMDPVHPSKLYIPAYATPLLYFQMFLFGPYTLYKMFLTSRNSVFHSGEPCVGPKFISRSKMKLTLDTMKRIRTAFSCSMAGIINSAILGALRKIAERKDFPIPEMIYIGPTVAMAPYPNENPQNRFTVAQVSVSMLISDPIQRLFATDQAVKEEHRNVHRVKTTFTSVTFAGLFPASFLQLCWRFANKFTYAVTNLPGFVEKPTILGNPIEVAIGFPPVTNGSNFAFGFTGFAGKYFPCFCAEKSVVVSSREDLEELIRYFNREIEILEAEANAHMKMMGYKVSSYNFVHD